jgi:hypothetical protein
MKRSQWRCSGPIAAALAILTSVAVAACGGVASGRITARSAAKLARWTAFVHDRRPLDVVGPGPGPSMVVAAAGKLQLLGRSGSLSPYATAYHSPGGEEPYIAWPQTRLKGPGGCSFGTRTIYAIRLAAPRGLLAIDPAGGVRRFVNITAPGLIDGIAYDATGSFGHRLVVTVNAGSRTTVDAIDCRGTVTTVTSSAPRVEGGIAVAPATFGRFAGDLIAPDETGGRLFAISASGTTTLLAASGLPHGPDIGVESGAFVPRASSNALLADRLTPGNRHPGDDELLALSHSSLIAAGVHTGDLLVATEGGALTDAVSCGPAACSVRHVANGPAIAHAEGHIAFLP